jgi:hypothetical protein
MNSWRILIFPFWSGERFSQKLSRVEKTTRKVSTTPLKKDYFYPSVGNIPCYGHHNYVIYVEAYSET